MVDELLLNKIASGRREHQLGVESRGVDTCSGIGHDLLDKLLPVELFLGVGDDGLQVILDIVEFVLLAALEVDLFAGLFITCLFGIEVEVLNGEHMEVWDIIWRWMGEYNCKISHVNRCFIGETLISF